VQFRRQVPIGGSFIADYLSAEVCLIEHHLPVALQRIRDAIAQRRSERREL
jgi:hypothetical protein